MPQTKQLSPEALPLPFLTPAAVRPPPPPLPLARFSLSLARHVAHFDPQPTTGLPQPAHLRPVPVRAAAAAAAARRTPPLLIGRRTLWRVTCPRLTVPPAPLVSFALSSVEPAAAAAAARFSRSSARACNRSALRAAMNASLASRSLAILFALLASLHSLRNASIAVKSTSGPPLAFFVFASKSSRFATHPKSRQPSKPPAKLRPRLPSGQTRCRRPKPPNGPVRDHQLSNPRRPRVLDLLGHTPIPNRPAR